jgi:hypothetical protein
VTATRLWHNRHKLGILTLVSAIRPKRTCASCIRGISAPVSHPIKHSQSSELFAAIERSRSSTMPSNDQTELSEPEQAETFNRVTNLPPQTQKSRERPSTPQHYRDNPDLLKSVFEWSPERTSTPVEENVRSVEKGKQQSDDPTVPASSLRRITKKIPQRKLDPIETRTYTFATTSSRRHEKATIESDLGFHTIPNSIVSSKASSTFTMYDGPDPFARIATSGQLSTARSRSDVVSPTFFVSRLDANSSIHTKRGGTG